MNNASVIASLCLFFVFACLVMAGVACVVGRAARDSFLARLPESARPWAWLGVAVFGVWLVHSGSKPPLASLGDVQETGAGTRAPGAVSWDAEALRCGLVFGGVFTNEAVALDIPSGIAASEDAVVHAKWRLRGAARDGFWMALPFAFAFGTNDYERVFVSASGTLSFNARKTLPRGIAASEGAPMPDGTGTDFLAVLQTSLGMVPEANWHLLEGARESVFWHATSARGALLLTWQNALLHRETGLPVSFQAELAPSGDVVFRYDFSALPDADCLTNITIGAQADFAGTDVTDAVLLAARGAPHVTAKWYSLRTLGEAHDDGDGLSNWDEIFVHRTDPRNPDSDGDGLWDGEEIALALDPNNADSAGDGTLDFWRVHDASLLTNAVPWATEGDVLFTVRAQLNDAAPDAYAVLRVGDAFVPVLPGSATSARFALGLDASTYMSFIPGPTMTGAETPSLAVVDVTYNTDAPVIFYVDDSEGLFDTSALQTDVAESAFDEPETAQTRQAQPAQRASRASGGIGYNVSKKRKIDAGTVTYTLTPNPLCLHSSNNVLKITYSGAQSDYFKKRTDFKIGFAYNGNPFSERSFGEDDATVTRPVNGVLCETIRVTPFLRIIKDNFVTNFLSNGSVTIPVHLCEPLSYESIDYSNPPLLPSNPYANREHKKLIIGGDPDIVEVVTTRESWWHTDCYVCGCKYDPPHSGACVHHAVTESSGGITHSGISGDIGTSTNKIFVAGVRPSTAYAGDWMTYAVGDCNGMGSVYSHGRYTVLGLQNYLQADGGHTNAPYGSHILAGVTNQLVFTTDVALPDGTYTVSLTGNAELIVRNRETGRYEVLLGRGGNTSTNFTIEAWRNTYVDREASFAVDARLVGTGEGTAMLRQSFSGSVSHMQEQEFTVHELIAEPISAKVEANGHVVNPAGFTLGDEAKFEIELSLARGISAGDITWSASDSGKISFVGGNTGKEVRVKGIAAGETELRISIPKLRIDNVTFFTTQVYAQQSVNVIVWVIRDDQGNGTMALDEITNRINNANKILWQRGIKLDLVSVSTTNKTAWLIHHDVMRSTNRLDGMLNCPQDTPGIELYFVEEMFRDSTNTNRVNGLCTSYGIVLLKLSSAYTLAHEVFHLYDLDDVYLEGGVNLKVSGLVGKDTMQSKDWGAGFYPKTLTQEALINRLLMKGNETTGAGYVLPSGRVCGVMYQTQPDGTITWSLDPVNVGLSGCDNRKLQNQ